MLNNAGRFTFTPIKALIFLNSHPNKVFIMSYKRINIITGWVVFLIATIVYLLTTEETTSLWDCGEYITTANKLEVGHPPGAPFFMMLGRLFSAFSSPENAAYMVNVMSALSSSATVLFMFWSLTMFAKKLAKKGTSLLDNGHIVAIMGTGFVGALAYAFTDSFWFSAVEGEVYAMSSFFTAIVFWAILKWEVEVDHYNSDKAGAKRGNPNRWIIFIAYMIGLSIGVHLLNLLAIPAIAFVIYFKKYEFNVKTFLIAGVISVLTLGVVQAVIIPKLPSIADWFERLFVNSLGMPFNTGAFFFLALLAGGLGYGIYYTAKKQKALWNTLILSFTVLLIGYSSFTMILVRSNANPPLDENNPETLSALVSYLNRDQYGTWPVLYGQYWNTPQKGSCNASDLLPAKVSNMKVYTLEGMNSRFETVANNAVKINELISNLGLNATVVASTKNPGKNVITIIGSEQSFMNMFELEDYQNRVTSANEQLAASGIDLNIQFGNEIGEKYINTFAHRPKGEKTYDKQFMTLFPRMYRQGEGSNYRIWCGYEGDINNPLPPTYRYFGQVPGMTTRSQEYQRLLEAGYEKEAAGLEKDGLYKPTMGENISFFKDYQINWMYVRYFLWNFSGRQNDTQGYGLTGPGSEILDGNWLSGVDFIDNQRLGSQENLPTIQRLNKGYNKYYLLPLILALIGFIFHIVKSPKDWFVILLLFLLTGLAIVIFLNQKPNEPRERDYAYAASFYAFAFWIGIGVYALFDAARNMKWKDLGLVAAYSLGAGVVLYGLEAGINGDAVDANHAFSYTIFYMSAIALGLHATMILLGDSVKNNLSHAALATGMCLVVPFILIYQNWDDHDRSNRSTARDFAYNYLASCDKNAMLFTNGDNDTFPLWYIQDVEGVRTDVRVANMSLLSTDWHINQMKRKAWDSDPLPITLNEFDYRNGTRDFVIFDESPSKKGKYYSAKEAINFIMNDQHFKTFPGMCNPESYIDFRGVYIPVDKEAALKNGIVTEEEAHLMEDTIKWNLSGGALYKADLAVLDILANYKWDRPINFASLGGIGANKGIAKYMQAEGVTYKLTPILFGSGGGTNTEKMYDLVMNDKFLWGNMKEKGVLVDYYTLRMVQNLRMQMMKLSDALISEGQNEKAIAILDKTFEIMPIENNQVAPDDICFYLVGNYYDAGAKEKGDVLGKKLALLELEKIDHYQSLNEYFFDKVWAEWGRSLNNLEMLRQASIGGLDQEAMIASDATNTFFTNQGALEGTGYSTTLISAKQIFLKKGYTKQKFFSNPQRFPVVLAQYCWMKQ
jgi:hypothetical protein